jgi:hypothetical protein
MNTLNPAGETGRTHHAQLRTTDNTTGRRGFPSGPSALPIDTADQLAVSAVSSTTNDVCNDESSVPVKVSETVWPANEDTLNERSV